MRLSVLIGTRPEAIKLAPLILEAKRRKHRVCVILTGQHRDIVLPLLKFFGITPDIQLDVMQPNQSLSSLSARILEKMDATQDQIEADFLIVQGDTTSACMAGYWGFCHRIPLVHVEAGLRTYDLHSPFPEEANRQLLSRIAQIHFAPTSESARALRQERLSSSTQIHQVGNTAIDALLYVLNSFKKKKQSGLSDKIDSFIQNSKLVVVTAHRRENLGENLERICSALLEIVKADPQIKIVFPVHPNPNVKNTVEKLLAKHPQILLNEPLGYAEFIALMQEADVLLTDSGGVQEEGPTLRKPILVLRDKTERPEGVRAGFSKLVGCDPRKIKQMTLQALRTGCKVKRQSPYGDGKASQKILKILEKLA